MESFQLTPDLKICRILNGMWQVSGGHGQIDPEAAISAMSAYSDAGFKTWDLADHYGPAEDFVGEFRRRERQRTGAAAAEANQFLTKWVPQPGPINRQVVKAAVERSLRRMDVETIDLLQFHWWDYEDGSYLEASSLLAELREEGLIRNLALTNFDTEHMRLIVGQGIPIVSNQVQYSLIDRRPEEAMVEFCRGQGIHLLAYGSLAGGLLSERYLRTPEPGRGQLNTASLQKYKQMIDAWGGWDLHQELLRTLDVVSERRNASIANLALRYVLDRPLVAGVIVGVRLGVSDNLEKNAAVVGVSLEEEDLAEIDAVLDKGRDLFRSIGDCGDEYRRR